MIRFIRRNTRNMIRGLAIAGVIASVYFLVSGVLCVADNSTTKDSQDYYETWKVHIDRESSAIVFDASGDWMLQNMGILKLVVNSVENGKQVFVGTADQTAVKSYMAGVDHDEIKGIYLGPDRFTYREYTGSKNPDLPGLQKIWIDIVEGKADGIYWNPDDGISLVIMNADGSSGIDLSVSVWTTSAYQMFAALSNLTIGVLLILVSLFVLFASRRNQMTTFGLPAGMLPEK